MHSLSGSSEILLPFAPPAPRPVMSASPSSENDPIFLQNERISLVRNNILDNPNYRCKGTKVLLLNPVTLLPCGENFDRAYIEGYFGDDKDRPCPSCGEKVESKATNIVLGDIVKRLLISQPVTPHANFMTGPNILNHYTQQFISPTSVEDRCQHLLKRKASGAPDLQPIPDDEEDHSDSDSDLAPRTDPDSQLAALKSAVQRKRKLEDFAKAEKVQDACSEATYLEISHAVEKQLGKIQRDLAKYQKSLQDIINDPNDE